MAKLDVKDVKKSALSNKGSVSAGMVLVGIVAAGSLARTKQKKRLTKK